MNQKKHLLLVAYFFPPIGGAGAQRPLKFAKYLLELDWDVTVLTVDQSSSNFRFSPADETLSSELSQIDKDINIIRTTTSSKKPFFSYDKFGTWSHETANRIPELLNSVNINAALITMSPFSAAEIGLAIKEHLKVPIIFDLRDPWALDGWQRQKSYFHWLAHARKMKTALRQASGVIANTNAAREAINDFLDNTIDEKLVTITNGYDRSDFSKEQKNSSRHKPYNNKFELLFTGSLLSELSSKKKTIKQFIKEKIAFSPEKIEYSGRTLIHLMEAFNLLWRRGEHIDFSIKCIGSFTEADIQSISNSPFADRVTFVGYTPHEDIIKEICDNSKVLFLPLHGTTEGKKSLITPGKTYEYLASGTPILGCLPDGDARDLVETSPIGVVANPCDPDSIADKILELVKIRKNIEIGVFSPHLEKYDRKNLTLELHQFLCACIDRETQQ